jgi:2,3-bisphosphoglycerate-dependent phosphoglycerate mutase
MGIYIVFETHSISEDNNRGIATGWHHGRLSHEGRRFARELGNRRRNDGIQAIFTSDLRRAVETVEIALGDTSIPILHDWRLRECDYGDRNGTLAAEIHHHRRQYLDEPYPRGESWRQAVHRVGGFLGDLHLRWEERRVLVVGHVATWWAFEHYLNGIALEDLIEANFSWREGWEYFLP